MSHALILQKIIIEALQADQVLTDQLGSGRVFDAVPAGEMPPYLALVSIISRDWSSASEPGEEHTLSFEAWSRHHGRRDVDEIATGIRRVLAGLTWTASEVRLINLNFVSCATSRDPASQHFRMQLEFRAVTEPAQL
ncbi:MAG: DUF3168 domain-containing protein [Rhizobiaceae bacterium]